MNHQAIQLARRVFKGAAASAIDATGLRRLFAGAARRAAGGTRVLILSYHRVVARIGDDDSRTLPTLSIAQETFRRHLEVLRESFEIVPLDRALAVLDGSERATGDLAVVTFDDGYKGVHKYALPVMRELDVPGVVYVPSGFVGTGERLLHDRLWDALERLQQRRLTPLSVGIEHALAELLAAAMIAGGTHATLERLISQNPARTLHALAGALEERLGLVGVRVPEGHLNMSWQELRELDRNGIVIGGHTVGHTVLTHEALPDAVEELARCKAELEAGLGRPVRHFAYCNGWYSPGLAHALQRLGFASAVTTEDLPNLPGNDPYALKRKVLWENSSAGVFGKFSRALTACQFDDVFSQLELQRAVVGSRPTRWGQPGGNDQTRLTAHG